MRKQAHLCFYACLLGLLYGVVAANVNHLPVMADHGAPFPAWQWPYAFDASNGIVTYTAVLLILLVVYKSNVRPSVVGPVPVDVVDDVWPLRPNACHVKPCETMGVILSLIKPYLDVSIPRVAAGNRPGWAASFLSASDRDDPSKQAGVGVVVKRLFETFKRESKLGASHDAVLSLIGQRPRSVGSAIGASSYYTGGRG